MQSEPQDPLTRRGESTREVVYALDNVAVELEPASIGSRSLAALIDYPLLAGVLMLWFVGIIVLVLATGMVDGLGFGEAATGWLVAVLIGGLFVLEWGFFAIQEIFLRGQTIGKQIVGLRTVGVHGGRPSALAFVIRNLVRSLDLLVGMPLMVLGPRPRRLGDLLAATQVVHEPKVVHALGRIDDLPQDWGTEEAALVEALAARLGYLERRRANELVERLMRCATKADPTLEGRLVGDATARLRHLAGVDAGGGD